MQTALLSKCIACAGNPSDACACLLPGQVIDQLDRNSFREMLCYTATDVTAAFGPNLVHMIGNPRLQFKV